MTTDKALLRRMLGQVLERDGGIEGVLESGDLESFGPEEAPDLGRGALERALDPGAALSPFDIDNLEAIIADKRPALFVDGGVFEPLDPDWAHLEPLRPTIQATFASIGRIELPRGGAPFAGTGFIVGPDLMMTNRHVARLFARGVGDRGLHFIAGDAAVDFNAERGSAKGDRSAYVGVREVVMIHPHWDMALLRIDPVVRREPLVLSTLDPGAYDGQDVVTVGYPARDPRGNQARQRQVFGTLFNVKRLQPGQARERRAVSSFGHLVDAITHDCSTLGGNSGSAVLDPRTGKLVALHFGGLYMDANFGVPAFELARDPRVVAAGVRFDGSVPATDAWDAAWRGLGPETAARARSSTAPASAAPSGPSFTFTVPLHVTVSVGAPTAAQPPPPLRSIASDADAREAIEMQVPAMYDSLETRAGYDRAFLGEDVPPPTLTSAGKAIAAKLAGGDTELRYHKFSVVMHAERRLALFTASNVDFRKSSREIDGRAPTRAELTEIPEGVAEEWVMDERIAPEHQLPDVFFTEDGGAFDKGHIVRRDDVCWGDTFEDIQMANGDTYHTTNCSPQVSGFNQSQKGVDNWGDLENLVQKQTKSEAVSIFAGPVLASSDRFFRGWDLAGQALVQIPERFWKIIVGKTTDGLRAFGFLLEQDLSTVALELTIPYAWVKYMVPIADIEALLAPWAKLPWAKARDAFESQEAVAIRATGEVSTRRR